jgi:hypothetical protein
MKAFEGDLYAIGPKKFDGVKFQDTNVLQIPSKLAEMSENRQLIILFCNTPFEAPVSFCAMLSI